MSQRQWHQTAPIGVAVVFMAATMWAPAPVRAGEDQVQVATRRALGYLTAEVPRWRQDNACFSCHNNGDAARAVLLDPATPPAALSATLAWLARPEAWTKVEAEAEAPVRDDRLARLQFTLALEVATTAGRLPDRSSLVRAVDAVAADQAPDGSWPIDEASPAGSPATYGRTLATALALGMLKRTDARRFSAAIARGDRWLGERTTANVADATALLIAQVGGVETRAAPVAWLERAQNDDGGWGPYARSPTEPFDTALALLALNGERERGGVSVADAIRRGRRALLASQNEDGSWPPTTRPAGGLSYAQQVSTTAWVAIALQVTQEQGGPEAPGG